MKTKLSGWGCFPVKETRLAAPRDLAALTQQLSSGVAIARGNGRAYGDSAIGRETTLHMAHFDRLLAFDEGNGLLTAEAGVLLSDIIESFLPRGWFPWVTPGTRFVTVGGMIAADVHGKNHHKDGCFGNFVEWFDLLDHQGQVRRCSRDENAALFTWTLGGMGLTGIVLRAAFRLRRVESGWIKQKTLAARNLDHAIDLFEENEQATYSVGWIDCLSRGDRLGRSLVMLGEHAGLDDVPAAARQVPFNGAAKATKKLPFTPPGWLLNRFSIGAFNALYYRRGVRRAGEALVDWQSYFYPLDAIMGWNKIYGRKGFLQFQCVLPQDRSRQGLRTLLNEISKAGSASFLAVIKRMGKAGAGISFPMEGYTLALDFPVNRKTLALLPQLDRITLDHGGRFYLAKDARLTAQTLRKSDERLGAFIALRESAGLRSRFQSTQAERLEL